MGKFVRLGVAEKSLLVVILLQVIVIQSLSNQFLTSNNLMSILNVSSLNIIFAVGLLVVLLAGGIDISFAVACSVVQYVTASLMVSIGGGNWAIAVFSGVAVGVILSWINAGIIMKFRIVSIVVTIATFNIYFGLLMFFTRGTSIYNLPAWWTDRLILWEHQSEKGVWTELTLPVVVMFFAVIATWLLLARTNLGRQIYAFGDSLLAAERVGIDITRTYLIAYGWLGLMVGIGAIVQVHYAQEVVPNALYGRELDVLAAAVLGGARLGGGSGSVLGVVLGVLVITITQSGLNLVGASPYAYRMIVGAVILMAIVGYSRPFSSLLAKGLRKFGSGS